MKKKQFYKILKTNNEVSGFKNSYDLMEKTFPSLENVIANSMPGNRTQEGDSQETITQNKVIQDTIKKQMGIAKSSLTFHKNHLEESALSKESVNYLEYILQSARAELDKIDFMIEQAQDYLTLTAFSQSLTGSYAPSGVDLDTDVSSIPSKEGDAV